MSDVTSRVDQVAATPRSWGPNSAGSGDADGTLPVTEWLPRAAATVDRLWNETGCGADSALWMRLGEASHAIHRALMALQDPTAS